MQQKHPYALGGFAPPPINPIALEQPSIFQPRAANPAGREAALKFLRNVSTLIVHHKIEITEVVSSLERANIYTIYDQTGQVVFYAAEDSNCCARQCCGSIRPLQMQILDIYQNEVVHISRPLACPSCCCFCCLMNVKVTFPPDTVAGTVQQKWSIIYPRFDVRNAVGETVLKIKGPCWTSACGNDLVFKIFNMAGEQVGEISKLWSGIEREYVSDADIFRIKFPENLNLDVKATLLGAMFLIDMMYFENE